MKKLLIATLTLGILIAVPRITTAHVLLTDESNAKGAILHITPDDDPIAGQEAMLYFDMQGQAFKKDESTVTVSIRSEGGEIHKEGMKVDKTLATARYIFPSQGVYQLTFTIASGKQSYIFAQTQRVMRGTAVSALDRPTYAWAEIALIYCGISFFLLGLTAFNRRKDIIRQSQW